MRRSLLVAAMTLTFAAGSLFGLTGNPNLLANPGFDANLDGWTLWGEHAERARLDANGSPSSGSAMETIGPGASRGINLASQCLPVTSGADYDFSAKVRADEPGLAAAYVYFLASADCTGPYLSGGSSIYTAASAGVQFQSIHWKSAAPAGAHSALVLLGASTNGGSATRFTYYDDVYFGPAAPPTCTPSATHLCIDLSPGDRRFLVVVPFATSQSGGLSGQAHAVSLASLAVDRGGLFWFFSADNPELLVKVLDGCGLTNFRWVFLSAGTNVGADVLVGDTVTGEVALFHNPDLGAFPAVQALRALGCD